MTFRFREAQRKRLTRDHAGRFLAADFSAAFGEAAFHPETGRVEYGPVERRGHLLLDDAGRIARSVTPLGRGHELRLRQRSARADPNAHGSRRTLYLRQGRVPCNGGTP